MYINTYLTVCSCNFQICEHSWGEQCRYVDVKSLPDQVVSEWETTRPVLLNIMRQEAPEAVIKKERGDAVSWVELWVNAKQENSLELADMHNVEVYFCFESPYTKETSKILQISLPLILDAATFRIGWSNRHYGFTKDPTRPMADRMMDFLCEHPVFQRHISEDEMDDVAVDLGIPFSFRRPSTIRNYLKTCLHKTRNLVD